MEQLILFGTLGCHLCEEAERLLAAHKQSFATIDIADYPEWQERYAVKIPVLLDKDSGAELSWPFDAAALQYFLRNRS
ncbi:MAG: glutaredoxin family protein [Gammaproteobacteria bacterium]